MEKRSRNTLIIIIITVFSHVKTKERLIGVYLPQMVVARRDQNSISDMHILIRLVFCLSIVHGTLSTLHHYVHKVHWTD